MPAFVLACLFAVLLQQLVTTTRSSLVLIAYPFGVDYGEGIVWQQMLNIVHGKGYSPIGVYPAIVYHYPPVFHLVTAAVAAVFSLDGLAAGRWVSWTATLATAALIGHLIWLARSSAAPSSRALTAILAGLIFLGCDPVIEWCATMRVDMLAGFFGAVGMVVAMMAVRRPILIHLAGLLFVAALFTKQVSVAAPIAAWAGLIATEPKKAWRLVLTAGLAGSVCLAAATWATHGGFLTHIFLYNINRFRPDLIKGLANPLQVHGIYIVLAGAGSWLLLRQIRHDRRHPAEADPVRRATCVTVLVFLVVKTAMLAMVMKSGASSNYLLEWCAALAMAAAFAIGPVVDCTIGIAAGRKSPISSLFAACLLGAVGIQAVNLSRHAIAQVDTVAPARTMWRLVGVIRSTPHPVISDEMTLLIRAGKPVEWEPAIAAELGVQGRYDQPAFIRLIKARRFGLFITAGGPGVPVFDSRYNPPVLAAIQANYPVTTDIDGFIVRRPLNGLRSSGAS